VVQVPVDRSTRFKTNVESGHEAVILSVSRTPVDPGARWVHSLRSHYWGFRRCVADVLPISGAPGDPGAECVVLLILELIRQSYPLQNYVDSGDGWVILSLSRTPVDAGDGWVILSVSRTPVDAGDGWVILSVSRTPVDVGTECVTLSVPALLVIQVLSAWFYPFQ